MSQQKSVWHLRHHLIIPIYDVNASGMKSLAAGTGRHAMQRDSKGWGMFCITLSISRLAPSNDDGSAVACGLRSSALLALPEITSLPDLGLLATSSKCRHKCVPLAP